jgi:hypothetical protein
MKDDGAGRAGGGNVDHLSRIEAGAVLHCIQQHLAKRGHQQIAIFGRQVGAPLRHEARQTIGADEVALNAEREPSGKTRDHLDPVLPVLHVERRPGHVGDLAGIDRRGEAGKHLRPQRLDDLQVRQGRRDDDRPDAWAEALELIDELEIVTGGRDRIGHQHVNGPPPDRPCGLERRGAGRDVVIAQLRAPAQRVGQRMVVADH